MRCFRPFLFANETFFDHVAGDWRSTVISRLGPCNRNGIFRCIYALRRSRCTGYVCNNVQSNQLEIVHTEYIFSRADYRNFENTEWMSRGYWINRDSRVGYPVLVFSHNTELVCFPDNKISCFALLRRHVVANLQKSNERANFNYGVTQGAANRTCIRFSVVFKNRVNTIERRLINKCKSHKSYLLPRSRVQFFLFYQIIGNRSASIIRWRMPEQCQRISVQFVGVEVFRRLWPIQNSHV